MRVDIVERFGPDNSRVRGSVRLDSDSGRVVFDPGVAFVELIKVFEPGSPPVRVTPSDGERYLRALPGEFRSGYVSAVVVDEG